MRRPIKTSEKDFRNRSKAYPSTRYALKEIITNCFFAPEVKNISLNFITKGDKHAFWFVNDGIPMTNQSIVDALSELGCESANTAGNENGTGLKSAASYFTQFSENSMLVLASKKNGELLGLNWIDPHGNYCEAEDLSKEQKEFVERVLSTFTSGTVTMVYDTNIENSELNIFFNDLRFMFTNGLDKVSFIANVDDVKFPIYSFDRHYRYLPYLDNYSENKTFEFNKKLFKCSIIATNTRKIKREDYTFIDETTCNVISDYGVHMGYDNGYMPIHMSQVEIVGYDTKPQYYHCRASLIAHPVEGSSEYAGVSDWKEFFSKIGKMSQQKVPNLAEKMNYHHKSGKDVGKVIGTWKSFYDSVIDPIKQIIQSTKPETTDDVTINECIEEIDRINNALAKQAFTACDSLWKFRFERNIDDVVRYDPKTQTVIFNFDKDSLFLKRLLKGGRNGRNGSNDLETIIIPIIDVFKMDAMDENTTDRVIGAIKNRVRKYNNYYSKLCTDKKPR